MSPRFVLGRENVPCVAEVVNRSLKADCTDFNKATLKLSPQKKDLAENGKISCSFIKKILHPTYTHHYQVVCSNVYPILAPCIRRVGSYLLLVA